MELFMAGLVTGFSLALLLKAYISNHAIKNAYEKAEKFINYLESQGTLESEFDNIHNNALQAGILSDQQITLLKLLYMKKYLDHNRKQ
jgi:hypothetical protein